MYKDNFHYLKEDRSNKPKESFKIAYNLAKKKILSNKKIVVADFGCATGDFVYYLKQKKINQIYGFDINKKFIDSAQKKCGGEGVEFKRIDLLKKDKRFKKNFDITFSIGVGSHFRSIEKYLSSLIFYTKSKGVVIVENIFNNYDLDVLVSHRHSNDKSYTWHSDWNFFSKKTVSRILKKHYHVKTFNFFNSKFNKILPQKKKPH